MESGSGAGVSGSGCGLGQHKNPASFRLRVNQVAPEWEPAWRWLNPLKDMGLALKRGEGVLRPPRRASPGSLLQREVTKPVCCKGALSKPIPPAKRRLAVPGSPRWEPAEYRGGENPVEVTPDQCPVSLQDEGDFLWENGLVFLHFGRLSGAVTVFCQACNVAHG